MLTTSTAEASAVDGGALAASPPTCTGACGGRRTCGRAPLPLCSTGGAAWASRAPASRERRGARSGSLTA